MVRTLALLALTLGLPAVASAQTAPAAPGAPPAASAPANTAPGSVPRHHHNRYMRAVRSLNLSDAQKQQIRGFVQAMRTANQNADPVTKRANAKQLRAQIDGVLTPDQRTQLRAALAAPVSAPQ